MSYWESMFGLSKDKILDDLNNGNKNNIKDTLHAAYERAHEIRQFEIKLYWQRAIYFWGFESILLYSLWNLIKFYLLNLNNEKILIVVYLIFSAEIIWLSFSILWLLVAIGAKQWQENWENHIDILEEYVACNLYKTILTRSGIKRFYSVTKINELIIKIFITFWIVCLSVSLFALFSIDFQYGLLSIPTGMWFAYWLANSHNSLRTDFQGSSPHPTEYSIFQVIRRKVKP